MSNNYKFKSIFKDELNYFIKYKQSIGYDYKSNINILKNIDLKLYQLKLKEKNITKDVFYELTKRNDSSYRRYVLMYRTTRDFCKFLLRYGYKKVYYENKRFTIKRNNIPITLTKEQINILFEHMDNYKNTNKKDYRFYYGCCILFRLLYSCGLRISEALKLDIDALDLNNDFIKVIDSKNHVSRIVPLSESMKLCLVDYLEKMSISKNAIFRNKDGKTFGTEKIRKFFKKILSECNFSPQIHIHNLRHCFANDAFNQMLEKGYNENVVIVYLHKIMGHKYISETEYYLHFIEYNRNKIINLNNEFSKKLYKEII